MCTPAAARTRAPRHDAAHEVGRVVVGARGHGQAREEHHAREEHAQLRRPAAVVAVAAVRLGRAAPARGNLAVGQHRAAGRAAALVGRHRVGGGGCAGAAAAAAVGAAGSGGGSRRSSDTPQRHQRVHRARAVTGSANGRCVQRRRQRQRAAERDLRQTPELCGVGCCWIGGIFGALGTAAAARGAACACGAFAAPARSAVRPQTSAPRTAPPPRRSRWRLYTCAVAARCIGQGVEAVRGWVAVRAMQRGWEEGVRRPAPLRASKLFSVVEGRATFDTRARARARGCVQRGVPATAHVHTRMAEGARRAQKSVRWLGRCATGPAPRVRRLHCAPRRGKKIRVRQSVGGHGGWAPVGVGARTWGPG